MKKLLLLIILLNILSLIIVFTNIGAINQKAIVFQRLACGFGLGASINPRWGYNNFDPRVEWTEETHLFPIPGGYIYSPDRYTSVSDFGEGLFLGD